MDKKSIFYTSLAAISRFDGPVTFLLNDEDIQLILRFKYSFGKYHPVFPKNT